VEDGVPNDTVILDKWKDETGGGQIDALRKIDRYEARLTVEF
jgi:hypothetical protein